MSIYPHSYESSSLEYFRALSQLGYSIEQPDHHETHKLPVFLPSSINPRAAQDDLPPLEVPTRQCADDFYRGVSSKYTISSVALKENPADIDSKTVAVAHVLTNAKGACPTEFINFVINQRIPQVQEIVAEYDERSEKIRAINDELENLNQQLPTLNESLRKLTANIKQLENELAVCQSVLEKAALADIDQDEMQHLTAQLATILQPLEDAKEELGKVSNRIEDTHARIEVLETQKRALVSKYNDDFGSLRDSKMGCKAELNLLVKIRKHFESIAKEQQRDAFVKRLDSVQGISSHKSAMRMQMWLESCTNVVAKQTAETAQAEFERRAQEETELRRQQEESSGYATGSTGHGEAHFEDNTVPIVDDADFDIEDWVEVAQPRPLHEVQAEAFEENKAALISARDHAHILSISDGTFVSRPYLPAEDVAFVLVDSTYEKGVYIMKDHIHDAIPLLKTLFLGKDGKSTHQCEQFFNGYDKQTQKFIEGQSYNRSKAHTHIDLAKYEPDPPKKKKSRLKSFFKL